MNLENWLTLTGIISSGVIGYFIKYFLDKKAQFSSHNAQIKRETYQDYVDFVLNFLKNIQEQETAVTEEQKKMLIDNMRKFHNHAVLYASPKVINAYSDMLQNSYHPATNDNSAHTMVLMTNIFKEMRKDIGLSNRGLKSGAIRLMRPLINDYDTAVKPNEIMLLTNAHNALNNKASKK